MAIREDSDALQGAVGGDIEQRDIQEPGVDLESDSKGWTKSA